MRASTRLLVTVCPLIVCVFGQELEWARHFDEQYHDDGNEIDDHYYYDLDPIFIDPNETLPKIDCFGACLKHFHDELLHGLGETAFHKLSSHYLPAIIHVLGYAENFETTCREFDGLLLCEDYCPEQSAYSHAGDLFATYCSTYKNEITSEFPCLRLVDIGEGCETRCPFPDYSLKLLASRYEDFTNATPEIAYDTMDKACRQAACDVHCMSKKALKSCGQKSVVLMRNLTIATFDYLHSALMNTTYLLDDWPPSCQHIEDRVQKGRMHQDKNRIEYGSYIIQSPGLAMNYNSSNILQINTVLFIFIICFNFWIA